MEGSNKILWYEQHAMNWNEALPIGNGRLGGMVYGQAENERIQLNEDSVWYGGPRDRNNPDALSHLPRVRSLLSMGKVKEAEELALLALAGTPDSQRHYEPLGDLLLNFEHSSKAITNYKRELRLDKALVNIQYNCSGVRYNREIFASYPDQIIAIRLTASMEQSISFQMYFERGHSYNLDELVALDSDILMMRGKTGGENGIVFRSGIKVIAENGQVSTIGNRLIVKEADTVTLLLSSSTSYRYDQPEKECIETLIRASKKSYNLLLQNHIEDYQSLFNRVDLELGDQNNKRSLPTNKRLELLKTGESDEDFLTTYFHFGRYLLISSSRPGSLPANLQGIWNDNMLPPWGSKFTININTQMNYWPAEVCNLTECHQPLFDHIEKMRGPGRKTAEVMYGCRGFTAHHNTDIWGDTAPQDLYIPATIWPLGAAWLCLHLWDHYAFTGDLAFLKEYYGTMKEAALFFVDYLVETPNGDWITTPSVSPENTYILPNGEKGTLCEGPSMDSQIIYALFSNCIQASERLNVDERFRGKLRTIIQMLPQPKIGKHGQIQEWYKDYEEAEPGHRHISHLFALHPGREISPRTTPDLAKAAKITLERRLKFGGGHTGWSRAWIINMWARLQEAEMAYNNLLDLLKSSTLPNLFDNHPPFQIDGNFGGIAGMAEMLIQSHTEEIHLLPSLPKAWTHGSVKGLKARGGFEIEMKWENEQLSHLSIISTLGGECIIRLNPLQQKALVENQKVQLRKLGENLFSFHTDTGSKYTFNLG
ncbi:glycoside hydrolase N-terminal domain-containing protein [Aquibacillus koreensis]|uniref:Glycoside hydrolase N-terminal domain-containing protein n=1 Tax=Aquibacillus koreensis TaxID=279446 RepID=A0A9X3WLQ1_9BACI|nr:glycoside hydrolase N-terminal domain-containing protein [Aquibacillus koreensis]MCT2536868.1 glycoside hydrolase N-terminal domain-containing protein [Aquibacillus koreensis]MDC3422000.1 glycoside hydrolase N-terminal domain-containing protein [Aquibacillus koreensis]